MRIFDELPERIVSDHGDIRRCPLREINLDGLCGR
jgi:hypothetical protein